MAGARAQNRRTSRRRWPESERRRIVELSLRDGASIREVAREHGVSQTSLCRWRARYRSGQPAAGVLAPLRTRAGASRATLLPVTIASAASAIRSARESRVSSPSVVEIMLPGITLRVEADVLDVEIIRALIEHARQ